MFPPPSPWKQLAEVDPDREYFAFTSRFFMKSPKRALAFLARSRPIQKQAENAPGIVGYSLGMNLFMLEFYTLSAWEDAEGLERFAHEAEHRKVMEDFRDDMRRESLFIHFPVRGADLPLSWKEAVRRQNEVVGKVDD